MTKHFLLAATAAAAVLVPTAALARPMTATDMHTMRRLGAPSVSPDGKTAIFSLSSTEAGTLKRTSMIHSLDLTRKGAAPVPLAGLPAGANSAVYGADGSVWFMAPVKDVGQVFRMVPGQAATQVSDFPVDVAGFKVSADGSRLVVWADRPDCPDLACAATTLPAKPEGSGSTYDEIFVRHWDTWLEPGVKNRIYAYPLSGGKVAGPERRVTGTLDGDSPSKPFGGGEEIEVSADGRTVYFALREGGRSEPNSTDLDIYAAAADGSTAPTNLTPDNDGTDNLPTLSPDGRTLAYVSMARARYEADRQVLKLRDLATGQTRALTQGWDASVGSIAWTRDGKGIVVGVQEVLEHPLYRVDVASGRATRLTREGTANNAVPLADGSVLYTSNSIMAPDDLYRVDARGRASQLTAVNANLLAEIDPVTVQKFNFAGANNARIWGIKVKPRGATGKLPVAFVVHGGPQGSFGNGWSYRWNTRLFAAPGYGVVSVDFHGSTGYGQAFTDAINKDWGGKPLEDLKKGLAHALANDPQLDGDRKCALGASYGGYMMYWIAGQWPDGFDCLIAHNGVFDTRSMGYMTEELWFTEWENGGPVYAMPGEYEKWNPLLHVDKWKTPTLVVIGDKDFRIPYPQGIAAFTAFQRKGVPSRLLRFPDENHWVLKAKNSVQWYDEVFAWMDRWTKADAAN
jgi:dipeptidyl aminopeptidase/acylaminoacyl peptidase